MACQQTLQICTHVRLFLLNCPSCTSLPQYVPSLLLQPLWVSPFRRPTRNQLLMHACCRIRSLMLVELTGFALMHQCILCMITLMRRMPQKPTAPASWADTLYCCANGYVANAAQNSKFPICLPSRELWQHCDLCPTAVPQHRSLAFPNILLATFPTKSRIKLSNMQWGW